MADLVQTATSVVYSGPLKQGIAGETITAGQTLCVDPTGGTAKLFRAKSSGSAAFAQVVGIACNGAAVNQPVEYASPAGPIDITIGATVAVGTMYVVSANLGAIAPYADLTTGNYCVPLGIADTATTILLNPWVSGIIHA